MGGKAAKERRRLERRSLQKDVKKASPFKKPRPAQKSAPKVKKSKKPKHLKRKLEQLSNEEDRQKVLEEMQLLEQTKAKFSGQKKQKIASTSNEGTSDNVTNFQRTGETVERGDSQSTSRNSDQAKEENNQNPKASPKEGKEPRKKDRETESDSEETKKQRVRRRRGRKDATKKQVESEEKESLKKEESEEKISTGEGLQTKKPDNAEKTPKMENKIARKDTKEESDSDSDVEEMEETPKRQRGRRRRGRKDTAQQIEESSKHVEETTAEPRVPEDGNVEEQKPKAKTKVDDRYCKGRKPVTDFTIGESYEGKVVYMKPFGVFIDIGCHSDAFCHVSRVQDDFIESPDQVLSEGDTVSARVVEIDRRRKRITVSLQSEDRKEDELKALESRTQRQEKRRQKYLRRQQAKASREESNAEKTDLPGGGIHSSSATPPTKPNQKPDMDRSRPSHSKDESEMTPAELKRARKLARRAARREEKAAAE